MNFEFSEEQLAFVKEVEAFLDANDDPEVFDLTRENMAQIVDTPRRRAFMASLGEKGWLGMTWPKEYGGSEGEGVYEYLLNEQLAGRGGPQIGKGVGIVGKTIIRHGNERLKAEFLPKILRNEVEFAVGYSEPNAGSDAASMQLKATRADDGWILNGQKTWTTSAHFAEWYWVGGRTDPDSKHAGITLFLVPIDQPGITVNAIWTMGDERTNEVFLNDVFVHDDYVVGEVGRGFQYISEALDLERFTMFTFSPIAQRFELLVEYVKTTTRDGVLLKDDPVVRQRLAQLATQLEVARVMGLKFVYESSKGGAAPTAEASEYKLFATELSKRLANASMDIAGPGSQLRVKTAEAPMAGRSESTYRYTVIDTIGGGASEIQKNIIARRKLGLPKNFRVAAASSSPHRPGGTGPLAAGTATGPAPGPLVTVAGTGPLAGITVLDFSTVGPAARCTRLLADYGARVVKVGPVPSADASPIEPPFFAYSGHRGMRRVQLDLKDDDGREAFLSLAAAADVVVESFRPGVVDRLGIGYDAVSVRNPGIVYCSTSGYGQDGPCAQWAGHDLDYLAVGGFLAMSTPGADGAPPLPGATIADAAAGGMQAALAITAALAARATSTSAARGCYLDVSVADGVLWLMSLAIDEQLALGQPVRPGHDVLSGRYACYGTYRAADSKWLAVAAIEAKFFANLCAALGCPELAASQLDDEAQPTIRAAFTTAFAMRTRDEWVEVLAGADTCVAPVLDVAEVAAHPQFVARGDVVTVAHPAQGTFRQLAPLLAGMDRAAASDLPDPAVTDTEHLLKEAGVDGGIVTRWVAKGVVA